MNQNICGLCIFFDLNGAIHIINSEIYVMLIKKIIVWGTNEYSSFNWNSSSKNRIQIYI